MKYLSIKDGRGYFLDFEGKEQLIDRITKDDILRILDRAIIETDFEMEEVNNEKLKNEADKIIYTSLYEKFKEIYENKNKFYDESKNLFRTIIEKYDLNIE